MDRVFADRQREFLADGAVGGLRGVGRAHHFAVLRNCVIAFENLHHDRLGRHEFAQFVIEGTLAVDRVEDPRLCLGQVDALLRDDAQAGGFQLGVDRAGQVAARRVGLDDREGALDRHVGTYRWGRGSRRCLDRAPASTGGRV